MGTWNVGLFSNDTACDVKTTYVQCLEQQLSNEDAYQKTFEQYSDLIGTDEEALFWYALADTQWNVGRLMPEVKKITLEQIDKKCGSFLWEENPKKVAKWENTLQKLKDKIESPMPPEKKFKKPIEFVRNPWDAGDIYAYQFHTEKAERNGLSGKYILFQKLGDVSYYDGLTFSVVQVFDRVYDIVPTLEVIKDIRVLPLAMPPGSGGAPDKIERYIPSFEWYMKAAMIYEKKPHYPKKYFTFVCNRYVPQTEYVGNEMTDFYLEKDGMEEWLVDYYLNWQNVEY